MNTNTLYFLILSALFNTVQLPAEKERIRLPFRPLPNYREARD